MAVVYNTEIKETIVDVIQHDNRNITITTRMHGLLANITGSHAPHAHASQKQKHKFYDQLRKFADQFGKQHVHLMLGDFNARLIENLPNENSHIGQHILTAEGASIEHTLSLGQKQNREMCLFWFL